MYTLENFVKLMGLESMEVIGWVNMKYGYNGYKLYNILLLYISSYINIVNVAVD